MTPARELQLLALSAAITLAGVYAFHKIGELIDRADGYWNEVSACQDNQRRGTDAQCEVVPPETR